MVMNSEEKKYLTPYIAWLNVLGNNEGEVSRFIKQVLQLPTSIQGVLRGFSTAEFIEDKLSPQFNLNNQQVNTLTLAVKDLLMGKLHSKNFTSNIQSSLNLGPETSQQIASMLSKELLGPVLEDIKKIQTERFPEKISRPVAPLRSQTPKVPDRPDLKIEPSVNRNNVVDLRNKQ